MIFLIMIILGVFLGWLVLAFRQRLEARETEVAREQFPHAKLVISNAIFYGQQSHGMAPLRGNGTLVITETEIYFKEWVTNKELRIPLNKITGLETPKAFLGKTNFRPILKIVFENEMGKSDAAVWWVEDLAWVKGMIEDAQGRITARQTRI